MKTKEKTSREPTPPLTPSSELGPKLRHRAGPPKVNEESGRGRTRNRTKETRPRKITIYWKIQHKLSQRPGLGTKTSGPTATTLTSHRIITALTGNMPPLKATKALSALPMQIRSRSARDGAIARGRRRSFANALQNSSCFPGNFSSNRVPQ